MTLLTKLCAAGAVIVYLAVITVMLWRENNGK